jgi:malate dehydrogenase
MDKKVTVVGAGNVGMTAARHLVEKEISDVVLVDVVEGLPQGKALDLMESAPIEGFKSKIIGTNDYEATAESEVVIITAGLARKPGMSRDDLLKTNAKIVNEVVSNCVRESPEAVLIIVTNPLDVMTNLAYKTSGFERSRVIGMAGILDAARYRYFISEALNVAPSEVEAMMLGSHGDSMVVASKHTMVKGKPLSELLDGDEIDAMSERAKKGGAEIVGLLKTGSAYFAPAASAVLMAKSILFGEDAVYPCCVYLTGEYGITDVCCGVPVVLSAGGVKEIVEIELTEEERASLHRSADTVKETMSKIVDSV